MKNSLLFGTVTALLLLLFIGWLDYLTGAELGFFLFYYVPLGLIGWYVGRNTAIVYSILAAVIWVLADQFADHVYTSEFVRCWNSFIRFVSFVLVSLLFSRLRIKFDREVELNSELTRALSEVKTLSGMLPICAACKKIRNDKGYWEQIEVYVRDRSEAEFSHGICPECAQKLYPQFMSPRKGADQGDKH